MRERKKRIRNAAFNQMLEHGYESISYQSIADEAGVERTHVQYYYPKKANFAIEYFSCVLSESARLLRTDDFFAASDWPAKLFILSLTYYSFLMETEGRRRLAREAFANREITNALIEKDVEWVNENVPAGILGTEDIVASTGGVYELIVYQLTHGQLPNPQDLAYRNVIGGFAANHASPDFSLFDIDQIKENYGLRNGVLSKMNDSDFGAVLSTTLIRPEGARSIYEGTQRRQLAPRKKKAGETSAPMFEPGHYGQLLYVPYYSAINYSNSTVPTGFGVRS